MFLHLWHVNNSLLLRGFLDAFSIDPDNIIKVLDLCHELKVYIYVICLPVVSIIVKVSVLVKLLEDSPELNLMSILVLGCQIVYFCSSKAEHI